MRRAFQTYLVTFATLLLVGLVLVLSATYVTDPYAIYRSHDEIRGLEGHTRIVKPIWVAEAQPDTLLIGSSRAEFLLDPDAVDALTGSTAFNMALSGANIHEIRRNAEHALAVAPIATLVIGLDFFMFNQDRPPRPNFSENRLAVDENGARVWAHGLADLPATLASRDALDAARRALKYRDQDDPCKDRWSRNGARTAHYYACQLGSPGAQQRLVTATLRDYLTRPSDLYINYQLDERPLPSNSVANIARLSEFAEDGRQVILYISPIHAIHLQLIERMGLWPIFEDWKRQLASTVADARQQGRHVVLMDFARISPLTGVNIFAEDRWQDASFYDSNHLHVDQRDRVLNVLFSRADAEAGLANRLEPSQIDEQLAADRQALLAWARENPADVSTLSRLADETEASRQSIQARQPLPVR